MSAAKNPNIVAKHQREGDAKMQEGEKCLSTGLFKWKPDFLGGSSAFHSAAQSYQNAGLNEKAIVAYKKAAHCFQQITLDYSVGTAYESAAKLQIKLNNQQEVGVLFEKAAEAFARSQHNTQVATSFTQAANAYKQVNNAKKVVECYEHAIAAYEADEHEFEGIETYKQLVEFNVLNSRANEGIEVLKQLVKIFQKLNQPHNVHKSYMYIVIVYLYIGNADKAYEAYNQFTNASSAFIDSQEYGLTSYILDAACTDDDKKLKQFIKDHIHNIREGLYAKLLKTMKPLGSNASPLAKITTLSFNDTNTNNDKEETGHDNNADFNDEDFEGIIPQKEGKKEEEEHHEEPPNVDDDELI